jgi:hypothetical protein
MRSDGQRRKRQTGMSALAGSVDIPYRNEILPVGEWRVQVSVRVSQATRADLEKFAIAEKRTLANFGDALLEWGFEQWKVVGSTERLMRYKILPQCVVANKKGRQVLENGRMENNSQSPGAPVIKKRPSENR